jgi:hypothetical protein
LGQDVYGFNAAIGLRVDPQDNVWTIERRQVVKFSHRGRVAWSRRKPETMGDAYAMPRPWWRSAVGSRTGPGAGPGVGQADLRQAAASAEQLPTGDR